MFNGEIVRLAIESSFRLPHAFALDTIPVADQVHAARLERARAIAFRTAIGKDGGPTLDRRFHALALG